MLWIFNNAHGIATPDICKIIAFVIGLANIITAAGLKSYSNLTDENIRQNTNKIATKLFAAIGFVLIVISMFLKGISCIYAVILCDFTLMTLILLYSYISYKNQTAKK